MMKTIKILVAGFMFAALVACDKLSNLIDQAYGGVDLAELDSLQAQDSEKMSVMLEAVALSLDSIQKQEEELYQLDESTPRDVMLSQLRTLRDMLDRKKAEIDQLTADSISEGKTSANLRKVLEYLSLQLEEKSENLAKYEEAVKNSEAKIAKLVRELLVELGEDPGRDGLKKTPGRVAKSLSFLTRGYRQDIAKVVNGARFKSGTNHMVILKDIELYSLCEHHMLPFYGKCAIDLQV